MTQSLNFELQNVFCGSPQKSRRNFPVVWILAARERKLLVRLLVGDIFGRRGYWFSPNAIDLCCVRGFDGQNC